MLLLINYTPTNKLHICLHFVNVFEIVSTNALVAVSVLTRLWSEVHILLQKSCARRNEMCRFTDAVSDDLASR